MRIFDRLRARLGVDELKALIESLGAQVAETSAQVAETRESQRALVQSLVENRVGHVENMLTTLLAESRNMAQESANRAADLSQLLRDLGATAPLASRASDALSLFGGAWPPHVASTHGSPDEVYLMQAAAEGLARVAELAIGAPRAAARTTSPLIDALQPNNGPIVIACGSLDAGGAERQVALTTIGLSRRGLPAIVVGLSEGSDIDTQHFYPLVRQAGVQIYNIMGEPALRAGGDIADIALRDRLDGLPQEIGRYVGRYYSLFKRLRPRVVHCWLDYINCVAGLAALWVGVPRVVLGLRNLCPMTHQGYQPFMRPVYRLMLQDPRVRLVANSRAGALDYSRWLEIDPEDIVLIANALEPDLVDRVELQQADLPVPAARSDAAPLILGVFRFHIEKDPLLFVRTAAEIAKKMPQARFAILGSGPLQAEAEEEARRLDLSGRFQFVGRQARVLAWMRNANLLLHTARLEGLPNVFLEAQSVGLPIVATRVGGASEAIVEGVTGVTLNSRDPGTIAEEVMRRLSDAIWLSKARSEGPISVSSRFSFATMVERTVALY